MFDGAVSRQVLPTLQDPRLNDMLASSPRADDATVPVRWQERGFALKTIRYPI